ncbi:MAG TPA: 6-hydroxymethylpterin diphosphokinase MptE-like protein [Thermoplasmata archaeon]|nr:6-hydroxymethylpterin diphosphokinase MptE-like protein [Thermoplasmata archaeon]
MEYSVWAPRYDRIRAEFGFPFEREVEAADLLDSLLPASTPPDPLARLRPLVEGRTAVIAGLAPRSGPPPIWRLPATDRAPVIIAADGATATCLDAGLVPGIVVTDLDGPVPAEVAANRRGSFAVLHAHGDNRAALQEWVPQFPGVVVGSWAGPPRPRLLNVGGFTDGDRAAYLADHLRAERVLLWGFDFVRTAPTDPAAHEVKLAKLTWASRLLGELAADGRVPLFLWRPDGTMTPYPPERYVESTTYTTF